MMKLQRRVTKEYFKIACLQYAPLIHKLAFKIGVNETHIEELKSQAMVELLKCMICYSRSGSFITFFYGRLTGVFKHMRDSELRAMRVQILSPDYMANISGSNCDMNFNLIVQECMKCLNDDERYVITQLFLNERTMRDLSGDFGAVASTICRIKTRAIDKMRQKCEIGLE